VHEYDVDAPIRVFIPTHKLFVFDSAGAGAGPGPACREERLMAEIRLQNWPTATAQPASEDYALRELDHMWEQGGAYALLGPSGCGKSTLLNIISGLLSAVPGQVLFDGKAVNELTPQKRNIAQVFQFPVVYDTMTVFDNLAFPCATRAGRGECTPGAGNRRGST
jgi:ABC-type sulfate/molybdate transport systems ATPase subunit